VTFIASFDHAKEASSNTSNIFFMGSTSQSLQVCAKGGGERNSQPHRLQRCSTGFNVPMSLCPFPSFRRWLTLFRNSFTNPDVEAPQESASPILSSASASGF
jgi:hypothetical protein